MSLFRFLFLFAQCSIEELSKYDLRTEFLSQLSGYNFRLTFIYIVAIFLFTTCDVYIFFILYSSRTISAQKQELISLASKIG